MGDETPIDPRPDAQRFSDRVIDFGDLRVQFGLPRVGDRHCFHKKMTYDPYERRVWCQDCERTIEGFDAFMALVRQMGQVMAAMERRQKQVDDAMAHSVRRRAAKVIDEAWSRRSMVPCCPHCSKALLPEDFADGIKFSVGYELEVARRKKMDREGGR